MEERKAGNQEEPISLYVDESGRTMLKGTRIRVIDIVSYSRNVSDPESYFEEDYPSLKIDHFRAAMDYYVDHKDEIDAEREDETRQLKPLNSTLDPSESSGSHS